MPKGVFLHKSADPIVRFANLVSVTENGCWMWTGSKTPSGYGSFWWNGKLVGAHIFSYRYFIGEIPNGLEIDHTCHNQDKTCKGELDCQHRKCVNPSHLEAVTHQVNVLRGLSPAAQRALITHCPQGHEYTTENTYIDNKNCRHCRICAKTRWPVYREARKIRNAMKHDCAYETLYGALTGEALR